MNDYLDSLIAKIPNPAKATNVVDDDALVRNQLLNYKEINQSIAKSQIINKAVYLIIFFNKEKDLNDSIGEIYSVANQSKIGVTKIDNKASACRILNQLYCNNTTTKFFDSKNEFGINKELGNAEVNKEFININNQFTKIIEIKQCPSLVSAGWLRKASNYQNIQTLISFQTVDTDIVQKNLERAKRKISNNWLYVRNEGEQYSMSEYKEAMSNMIHDYAKGYSKAWYVNISFVLTATSEVELRELVIQFTKELKSVDRFNFELLDYHQYDVFKNIFSFQ
jgi:hypothetical protein